MHLISSLTSELPESPMNPHLLSDADVKSFQQGTHCRLQEKLGAHPVTVKGVSGVQFAVWAPNAERSLARAGTQIRKQSFVSLLRLNCWG